MNNKPYEPIRYNKMEQQQQHHHHHHGNDNDNGDKICHNDSEADGQSRRQCRRKHMHDLRNPFRPFQIPTVEVLGW